MLPFKITNKAPPPQNFIKKEDLLSGRIYAGVLYGMLVQ